MKLPCFRQCGLCPGDPSLIKDTYAINNDDPARGPVCKEETNDGDEDAIYSVHDCHRFQKVYADGSAMNGRTRELARAGWGVFTTVQA